MFVRNGEKLGSVLVDADPSDAEPKRQPAKAAVKPAELTETEKEADAQAAESRVETPEPEQVPDPVKPAKKAAFKSALDKG